MRSRTGWNCGLWGDSWYDNPVARVLRARAAASLDALQQLRESCAQLARERPVLDDAAIGMPARAQAAADDQPAAYLADRTTGCGPCSVRPI